MDQEQLASVLESILFVSNKPLSIKDLSKLLEQQAFTIQAALEKLTADRKNCGIVILENNGEYQLATNSKNSTPVKNFLNAELREKLTDATVEVLAIITYRQPISKAEIEAIRGVNSQYSIRHLLMRGLIEKAPNPNDARGFLYQTTTEFLQHMGLTSVKDLPEFDKLVEHIKLPQTPQAVPETTTETTTETEKTQEEQPIEETVEKAIIIEAPAAEEAIVETPDQITQEAPTEIVVIETPVENPIPEPETIQEPVIKPASENEEGEEFDDDDEFDEDDEDEEE